MTSVWKDKDIVISTTEPVEYTVATTDEDGATEDAIYTGIASPKPKQNQVKIRLNDFAKNIVNSDVDSEMFSNYTFLDMPNYCMGVGVHWGDAATGVYSDYEMFTNNYDYINDAEEKENNIICISNPLKLEYEDGGHIMFSLFSTFDRDEKTVEISSSNGDYYNELDLAPKKAVLFQLSRLPIDTYEVYYEDKSIFNFKVIPSCHRYRLHYVNAKGGYDTMTVEGLKDKRTDNFEFSYFKSRGNNQSLTDYQMNKFQTNITTQWELQTGWLNDEQSLKMYNLFGSHKVWLEDTEENKIYPVYITNKSVVHKTFTNNGKRKINYTISVTSANTLVKF